MKFSSNSTRSSALIPFVVGLLLTMAWGALGGLIGTMPSQTAEENLGAREEAVDVAVHSIGTLTNPTADLLDWANDHELSVAYTPLQSAAIVSLHDPVGRFEPSRLEPRLKVTDPPMVFVSSGLPHEAESLVTTAGPPTGRVATTVAFRDAYPAVYTNPSASGFGVGYYLISGREPLSALDDLDQTLATHGMGIVHVNEAVPSRWRLTEGFKTIQGKLVFGLAGAALVAAINCLHQVTRRADRVQRLVAQLGATRRELVSRLATIVGVPIALGAACALSLQLILVAVIHDLLLPGNSVVRGAVQASLTALAVLMFVVWVLAYCSAEGCRRRVPC